MRFCLAARVAIWLNACCTTSGCFSKNASSLRAVCFASSIVLFSCTKVSSDFKPISCFSAFSSWVFSFTAFAIEVMLKMMNSEINFNIFLPLKKLLQHHLIKVPDFDHKYNLVFKND